MVIPATEDATTIRTVNAMVLGLEAFAEVNGAFEAVSEAAPINVVRVLTLGVFTSVGVDWAGGLVTRIDSVDEVDDALELVTVDDAAVEDALEEPLEPDISELRMSPNPLDADAEEDAEAEAEVVTDGLGVTTALALVAAEVDEGSSLGACAAPITGTRG